MVVMSNAARASIAERVCAAYASLPSVASRGALDTAAAAPDGYLMEKHKKFFAATDGPANMKLARDCGFNTLMLTMYPLHGHDWWAVPAYAALVRDSIHQARAAGFRVYVALSIFNGQFCDRPERYPGASRTIQCDGTRPSWVCFFDDALWDYYNKNLVELVKAGGDELEGILIDPESYGPECYLCFCPNCIRKFNAYAHQQMPADLVKPDAWLNEHGLWLSYARDYHDHEVLRHAKSARDEIHKANPWIQLGSLLWDYPVAVGAADPRAGYYRSLVIGLGTKEQPAWSLPEHTYYSDTVDLKRLIGQMREDLRAVGAEDRVRVMPGLRILRQSAASLTDRAKAIRDSEVPGYWLYELADLTTAKTPIDFEGAPIEPLPDYVKALKAGNEILRGHR